MLSMLRVHHFQQEHARGLIGISGKALDWIKMSPNDKYTGTLSEMDRAMENYKRTHAGDEIWLCGGKSFGNDEDHDQSKSCIILSLLDSDWRTLEFKMNLPRIKTGVFTEGSKVIVMG